MLFAQAKINLYMNERHWKPGDTRDTHPYSSTEATVIARLIDSAPWEAVENWLQEGLDMHFPKQFTIEIKVE